MSTWEYGPAIRFQTTGLRTGPSRSQDPHGSRKRARNLGADLLAGAPRIQSGPSPSIAGRNRTLLQQCWVSNRDKRPSGVIWVSGNSNPQLFCHLKPCPQEIRRPRQTDPSPSRSGPEARAAQKEEQAAANTSTSVNPGLPCRPCLSALWPLQPPSPHSCTFRGHSRSGSTQRAFHRFDSTGVHDRTAFRATKKSGSRDQASPLSAPAEAGRPLTRIPGCGPAPPTPSVARRVSFPSEHENDPTHCSPHHGMDSHVHHRMFCPKVARRCRE